MSVDAGLPGADALTALCTAFGVSDEEAQLLHHRSNAVYLLPAAHGGPVIARLAPDTELRRARAGAGIAVTRWLNQRGSDAIALRPLSGAQPVFGNGAVATFWPYRPSPTAATLSDVAILLRRLHDQPIPPFPLPRYRPLHRLREALALDASRRRPALGHDDHMWLTDRAGELVAAYAAARFPLGDGLVHADAHTENVVSTEHGFVLIDWDGCCIGPRELDLISALPDHFHAPEDDRHRFLDVYGYDLLAWPQWPLLRDIAEMHSLGAYIRLAPDKPRAAEQLAVRLASLRTGDRRIRWSAIS
ncbi:phosphotransferase family protein [Nocardia asteroides]|uniref:phosphotransferase family protein n=1 Tax=Nocardia asteroides TaxID=1824 RepID=UPI001E384979|nr:aminoglycoside phosphotransferase family protein [Nocardia asteroides]UGT64508.1 aminoglycoside phosphotransferase family protein [Nocardia asteroides]